VALEPRVLPASSDNGNPCSPKPCTAPGGFELYVRSVDFTSGSGRVTMEVSFKNNTPAGQFEAVTYRHTNPADFSLAIEGGGKIRPTFGAGCPNWSEDRVVRGGAGGPDRLCFDVPPGTTRATLFWSPDEGFFSVTGSVPLG
jgi:hypothetical protein